MTQVQKLQLNNQVDKILHTPGNAPAAGQQLEMAFVFDLFCDEEYLKVTAQEVVATLKRHSTIFQNVRSNVVYWGDELSTEAMPMSFIQMGKPFENPQFIAAKSQQDEKTVEKRANFDDLCAYLKLFHARSKCIIVITREEYVIENKKKVFESLNPFLKSRLLVLTPDKMVTGATINIEMMRQK